ncbi:hypothetical protein HPB49_009881 [Dermacentor silvarum]|uniref:Uncharacterized protein n=1 Tax=Dermacentor silvarum TaxID=543639 RepID=A0ACB8C8M4_DERSI|nr:hypothetical protein HPB49_009881 [Dermacentor silvarum]
MCDFHAFVLLATTLSIYVLAAEDGQAPVIKTVNAFVSGVRTTIAGKCRDMYLGIPYAKLPKSPLRFRKPVPLESWN